MGQRWTIAILALLLFVCVVLLLGQFMLIRDLKNSSLAVSTRVKPVEIASKATSRADAKESPEDELSKQNAEIERLTKLANQIASEVAQLEQMSIENEKLKFTRPRIAGLTEEEAEEMGKATEKAMSVQCVNNLKQLGLAARVWALDNEDMLPPDIVCMSNELANPNLLVCPADPSRQVASDWSSFGNANCSYEHLAASGSEGEPSRVLSRCPVHGHVGLCDGSVQNSVAKNHPDYLVRRDGKLYLESPTASTATGEETNETP